MTVIFRFSICLLFLFSSVGYGQMMLENPALRDSLKGLLNEVKDTTRVNVLNELSMTLTYSNSKMAYIYADEAYILSDRLGFEKGKLRSLMSVGRIVYNDGYYRRALKKYQTALDLCSETFLNEKAVILFEIGNCYHTLQDYELASKFFFKSLELAKKVNDENIVKLSHAMIAEIHNWRGDHEKSLVYIKKNLEVSRESNDSIGIAVANMQMGVSYLEHQKDNEKAKEHLLIALDYYGMLRRPLAEAYTLHCLSNVFQNAKEYQEAEACARQALALVENKKMPKIKAYCYRDLAAIERLRKNYKKAIEFAELSLRLTKKYQLYEDKVLAYRELIYVYGNLNDGKNSLKYFDLYTNLKDSIASEEMIANILELESKYQNEQKEKQLLLATQENELKNVQLKLSIIVYAALLVLLVVLGYFWYQAKKNRYEKELTHLRVLKEEYDQQKKSDVLDYIPISGGKKMVLYEAKEVAYFYAENKYVFLKTKKGKSHIIYYTLKQLEDKLPENFARVHKSFIINKDIITNVRKSYNRKVVFTMDTPNKDTVPSGVKYADVVEEIT